MKCTMFALVCSLALGLGLGLGLVPSAWSADLRPGIGGPGQVKAMTLADSSIPIDRVADVGVDRAPSMCPPIFEFTGEVAEDQFGYSVAGGGDINGDGYDDVIVGALLSDAAYPDAGQVYVYSGLTGNLIYQFTGEGAEDYFGTSVASAGDVNGDGYADVIIGAPKNDAGGVDAGRVYVFSGRTGDTLYVFTGDAADDWLGWSVAGAGDVNADGYDDIIVGAPQSSFSVPYGGRVVVYSGQNGIPLYAFNGELDVDVLGSSVASAGDVDNDGYADVIIGAHLYGATNAGRVYVFSGQTGDTLQIFDGEAADDHFGYRVQPVGDVDGDNFDDVMVGAPLNDAGAEDAGRAYVYSGQTGAIIYTFTGEGLNDQLGYGISAVGNIDGDGVDDLAVGAWGNNAGGLNAGRVYVYSGATGDTLYVITGQEQIEWLGTSVSSAGDANPSGFDDLIIGAPGFDWNGVNTGRVYVYRDGCCCEQRGDCDMSGDINVSDLTYLVALLFQGGPAVDCPAHGDVDGDESLNVSDLTHLVAFLFSGGAPPAACP